MTFDQTRAQTRKKVRPLTAALLGVVVAAGSLMGCSGSTADAKTYDISPIFPASPNTCQKYHGDKDGSGPMAACWVTESECKRAATDWRNAMQQGDVDDAIQFTCESSR